MPKEKGRPRYFLAGVNVEDDDLDIHFLVEDSSGRDGDKISEVILKSLLPSHCTNGGVRPSTSRSRLIVISPTGIEQARAAQIPAGSTSTTIRAKPSSRKFRWTAGLITGRSAPLEENDISEI
jgi:hypothetical protein